MGASAFVLGFFVAIGAWTAGKVTKQVDTIIDPPKIEKLEKKEKEDDRRN